METIADRLNQRMAETGMTQERLAELASVSQTTIHKLCTGKAKESRKLVAIATVLGVTSEWLQSGKTGVPTNVSPGPELKCDYPLISWVQAGTFCGVVDLYQPGDAERFVSSTKIHGPHTYVLRVEGDSMVSPFPGQRTYLPGCLIFVDPDRSVTNGCRVIAKLPAEDAATFKVYAEDGGKRYLKPLNPQYPTIEMTPDIQICGVVVSMTLEE
jgi:SOS-response transcriptional repressor LexA